MPREITVIIQTRSNYDALIIKGFGNEFKRSDFRGLVRI